MPRVPKTRKFVSGWLEDRGLCAASMKKTPGAGRRGSLLHRAERATGACQSIRYLVDHFDDAVAAVHQHRALVDDGVAGAARIVLGGDVVIGHAGARQDGADAD